MSNSNPSWIAGKGHKGLSDPVSSTVKTKVSDAEKQKAKSKVGKVGPGKVVVPSTSNTELSRKLIDGAVAAITAALDAGRSSVLIDEICDKSQISKTFIKFNLRNNSVTSEIEGAVGVELMFSDTEIKFGDAQEIIVAGPSQKKRKKVKAAERKLDRDYFFIDATLRVKLEAILTVRTMNIWIAGPTGTGKSETIERVCEEAKIPYRKVSMNGESSVDDLLGHYRLEKGDTVWVEGALPEAAKAAGLTPVPSVHVKPPSIAQCPINVECRIYTTIAPPHMLLTPEHRQRPLEQQHTIYFAEVLGTYSRM